MASLTVHVAGGTGDVQAFTGSCSLVGYSVQETAGSVAGEFVLRDGTSTSGAVKVTDSVSAGLGKAELLPAVPFSTGIFVDRSAGTTELVLYLA